MVARTSHGKAKAYYTLLYGNAFSLMAICGEISPCEIFCTYFSAWYSYLCLLTLFTRHRTHRVAIVEPVS